MKITKLELIKVKPRWMFLKMYTDTDIIGLGEPVLEGHCNAVEAIIKEYEEYLIGKDPMQIEHHVQALYRGGFYRGGPIMLSAISGIEQAMWDIKGSTITVLFGSFSAVSAEIRSECTVISRSPESPESFR